MRTCGTGARFGFRSALFVTVISLAAAGCGGGGGGGATASNTSGSGGQTTSPPAAPAPVSPFTPPAATPPPATPTPTAPPAETPPAQPQPPATPSTPPAQAPSVTNGGITLAWEVPAETNTLGTLAGYHIHYGNDANVLSETIVVDNPGVLSYVVDTLPTGTYYFAVRAVMTDGSKSGLSNVISKVIS